MPPKGTINLGFVKAIHSGVNPPLNKKMIWYDENEFVHKAWDVVNETWDYFKINPEWLNNKADRNSSNLTEEDILSWREKLELFTKTESLEKFMQLQEFTYDGKIRADKIEALGLTEIILTNEVGISAFVSNYASYTFQKNDIIAVLNSQGTYDLYIYIGYDKSSAANYLATGLSNITIGMVQGLQQALDSKIDKDKFIAISKNHIPFLHGSSFFFDSPFYVDTTNNYFVGMEKQNPTELLDINGNIKTLSYKFSLPTKLIPQPNMLIAKTDGSGLMWYNNSSIGAEIPSYSSPISGYVARWDGTKFVNGTLQDNGNQLMFGKSSFPPVSPNRDRDTLAKFSFPSNFSMPFHFGACEYVSGEPGGIQAGDFWVGNQNVYLNIGGWGTGGLSRKLIGLEINKNGNSKATWNFDTINNDFFNGTSLICTGNYNGNLLISNTSNVGVDSRMYQGALYTVKNVQGSSFTTQQYYDYKGNIFTRGLGAGAETDWKKAVMERTGYTTRLVEKLALSRVKLKSYTKSERDALSNKEVGEIIWQTDVGNSGIRVYDGTNWLALQTTID